MDKFKSYTRGQVERALLDCHETLRAGEYSPYHPYGKKLWAEIDALRVRRMALAKNKPLPARDRAHVSTLNESKR